MGQVTFVEVGRSKLGRPTFLWNPIVKREVVNPPPPPAFEVKFYYLRQCTSKRG